MLCCTALENGSSYEEVGRNTRLRPVFPPKLLSCSRRFLRALQWNRAQSRLLYFLIIAQFVVCPHLTQWQRNGPSMQDVPSSILGGTYIFLFSLLFPFLFFILFYFFCFLLLLFFFSFRLIYKYIYKIYKYIYFIYIFYIYI